MMIMAWGTVGFRHANAGEQVVPSESTLIFRSMPDLERTLAEAGFTISEVRDAADRPGREWVVIARVRA